MENDIVTLVEDIPPLGLRYENKAWGTGGQAFNGWRDLELEDGSLGSTKKCWAFQTDIDVSGWGNQGLTFYPLQAGLQEGYMFSYINDDLLQVIDIMTDSPFDVVDFCVKNTQTIQTRTLPALYQNTLQTPTLNSDMVFPPLGFENILYGNSRNMGYNSNFPTAGGTPMVMPINSNDFGSMNPTATDKIYITRLLICDNAAQTDGFMFCPPARFILKGQLKRETDLSYIYRLKDSFKTAQTDVGYNEL